MTKNRTFSLFIIIMAIAGIIWTFTNVGVDVGYQTAMAYRLSVGDEMIVTMLEPHQTSAFITGGLIALYRAITGGYTGVVVYLQAIGTLIRAAVAFGLYLLLKKEAGKGLAFAVATVFFMITPKDYAIPEYGNQQVWFGALSFVFLVLFFTKEKLRFVLPAAICLCFQIFSYPSCLILYIAEAIMIFLYAKKGSKIKAFALFTGTCIIIGGFFASYFLFKYGYSEIRKMLGMMLSIEPGHTVGAGTKLLAYIRDAGEILLAYAAVAAASFIIELPVIAILKKKRDVSAEYKRSLFFAIGMCIMLVGFLLNILLVTDRCAYTVIFFYLIGVGIYYSSRLSGNLKKIYITGTVIGLAGFLSTTILTDLPLIVSGGYAVLSVGLSLIPIKKMIEELKSPGLKRFFYGLGIAMFALLFLRCIYLRTTLTGRSQITSIFRTDMSYVHNGPAKYIITDNNGAMKQQLSYAEFNEYIPEGSNIFIADGLVDGFGYLYTDTNVAVPSVMCDPKYGYEEYYEVLREYWKKHPERYPDVVIVSAYNGEISYEILASGLFMKWLEEEYKPSSYIDGVYYRYYFK